mgnify:CR=1 FL=1
MSACATIGYVAFLAGPPLLGFLAEHLGQGGDDGIAEIGGVKVMARVVEGVEMRDLKSLADEGKTRLGSGIVAIVGVAPDGKAVETWRENYPYDELMTRNDYDVEKYLLQIELLKFQRWQAETGHRQVIVFEGPCASWMIVTWHASMFGRYLSIHSGVRLSIPAPVSSSVPQRPAMWGVRIRFGTPSTSMPR